jgi:hypothetical protein
MMRLAIPLVLVLSAATACRTRDAGALTPAAAATPDAAAVVDSALAPEETLRRFRVGLDSVARLDGGSAPSRDALVDRFIAAVAIRDTAALRRMSLSRAEFAYLYYPSTQYLRPPYATAPDILWQLMTARSGSGMRRLVARVGGTPIHLASYECEPKPRIEGDNRLFERCSLRYRRAASDSVEQRRLFGSIIARGGRYKFVSYANDF